MAKKTRRKAAAPATIPENPATNLRPDVKEYAKKIQDLRKQEMDRLKQESA
tara:strand:+ start:200 stop:352 length:153 start_codon:yes stop_codon:yes gene_type:complete